MNGYFAIFIAERGREEKNSDTLVEGWEFVSLEWHLETLIIVIVDEQH
jgi:hypothetical protein